MRALGSRLALALALTAAPALADTTTSGAAAEVLFEQGRVLMNEGKTEEACAKFAASQRIDPAPGTLLRYADCSEKLGRTATAWLAFREAEARLHRDGDAQREDVARARVAALAKRLTLLRILVVDAAPGES